MASAFGYFTSIMEALAEKKHDLGTDTFKVALTNSAPAAGNAQFSDITEIAAGNGYVAGGTAASITSSTTTGVTYKWILADVVFTASGGTIGPFRYAVLYNDTSTNDLLIGYWDYGAATTLNAGETFTVDFSATNGVLTITHA